MSVMERGIYLKKINQKNNLDILYLGCNMGNAKERFFSRYEGAEQDYYDTFDWLICLNNRFPDLRIGIKHHGGDYSPSKDPKEMALIKDSKLIMIDNRLDTYKVVAKAKMCVAYFTRMILELNGYYLLAETIGEYHRKRRNLWRRPCNSKKVVYTIYKEIKKLPKIPSYYLDTHLRNRQFCRYIDDCSTHICGECKGLDLEIYKPYRIKSYAQFERIVVKTLKLKGGLK